MVMERFLLIVALVFAYPVPQGWAQSTPPFGIVINHNGTINSNPQGSGDVDVAFNYSTTLLEGPHSATYNEIGSHEVMFDYQENDILSDRSFFANRSGIAWQGFKILLQGADFAGWNADNPTQAASINPLVDVGHGAFNLGALDPGQIGLEPRFFTELSPITSSITRFNDQGSGFTDAELTILFGQPLPASVVLSDSFALHYNIIPSPGAGGPNPFTATFTPIPIPEPATAALLGFGLLGFARRRRGR